MIKGLQGWICGLAAFFAGASQAYIVDGARVQQPKLLAYVQQQLLNQGIIEQAEDGLTYVKLPAVY